VVERMAGSWARWLAWLLVGSAIGCGGPAVDLSPGRWPAGELARYQTLDSGAVGRPEAGGLAGRVASTMSPLSVRAGLEALTKGGTAADAAIVTTLAQTALSLGGAVSLAGQMTVVYYDAATGQSHSFDASFDTPAAETDPSTIPPIGAPSGRAAPIPGVVAGLARLHGRFGRLPWSSLFGPARYFAETGVLVGARMNRLLQLFANNLARLPEGRAIFLAPNGIPYGEGDRVPQPALAETLRQLASQGPDYFYRGVWARRFVEVTAREGGVATEADLARYSVIEAEPITTTFRDFQIVGPSPPTQGGVATAQAFNLFELADLRSLGHFTASAEALDRYLRIAQAAALIGLPDAGSAVPDSIVTRYLPSYDSAAAARVTKDSAKELWKVMVGPTWLEFTSAAEAALSAEADKISRLMNRPPRRERGHTSGVVVIDAAGNVAAVMHSINSAIFGDGIFVDGVSLSNSLAFQQALLSTLRPGSRVPVGDNPLIVLRHGRPYLASSSVGFGYYEVALQGVLNVLEYGMTVPEAAAVPLIGRKWPPGEPLRVRVGEGGLPAELIDRVRRSGVDIEPAAEGQPASPTGLWVAMAASRE